MSQDVTAIAIVALPSFLAPMVSKVTSPGRGLLSAPFPPPMLALNDGARIAQASITDPSSLIGMTTVENTALSKWTINLYQFTRSCIVLVRNVQHKQKAVQ